MWWNISEKVRRFITGGLWDLSYRCSFSTWFWNAEEKDEPSFFGKYTFLHCASAQTACRQSELFQQHWNLPHWRAQGGSVSLLCRRAGGLSIAGEHNIEVNAHWARHIRGKRFKEYEAGPHHLCVEVDMANYGRWNILFLKRNLFFPGAMKRKCSKRAWCDYSRFPKSSLKTE